MDITFPVATDTATLVIFDLQALKHRIADTADWWSIEEDAIDEMNNGNVIFLDLRADGAYRVELVGTLTNADGSLSIHCPSGQVFIGAGEDTTGDDLEPDDSACISGRFIDIAAGRYAVGFKRDDNVIRLSFAPTQESKNSLSEIVRL
ncbi:hypothetical protein FJU30_15055 [Affinibrenneria salicis]|uniref:Uncharacterized protein n=1 Tax=Affinibrenneria salicis TaxID=2590031 RepID=A0A5J5G094_9GAMM|nr:DUF6386 family protein [Affinibrenneria salicis]KAA8998991.1 hypothetical protein FJU30_15055 [Affinibrenneria salicis]